MPFGFSQYLKEQGRSEETIKGYLKTVNMFFRFLDNHYGVQIELYQISSVDIKNFLKDRIEKGNKKQTVNKHLTILKSFFDYLWQVKKVPFDPTVKIKRYKVDTVKPNILTYELLLDKQNDIIQNPDYTTLRKSIYVLALQGLRTSEYQILKRNVVDHGDSVDIILNRRMITLKGIEAEVFLRYFIESQFNDSNYVFITKKHDNSIVPVEHMSIHMHLNAISQDYNFPTNLTLNKIRHAYTYYLYNNQDLTIEEIANVLGIEIKSAAKLVENSIKRHRIGKESLDSK